MKSGVKWYDITGKPLVTAELGSDEWKMQMALAGKLLEDPSYKVIGRTKGKTKKDHELIVSTVWLGLDHSMIEGSPIEIFETMVFDYSKDGEDIYQTRYSTLEQAVQGHQDTIKKYLAKDIEEDEIHIDEGK